MLFISYFWLSSIALVEARSRNGLDFNEDEVVLALSEDTTALQNYAIGFWKPLPAKKDYEEMFFHVQVNSALIGKLPIMNDLVGKLAQQADFLNLDADHVGSDMRKLFAQEEEISASFPEKNTELSAHKNLMKFHLQSLLSKPRNGKLFPANREEIGGFIFREMAKSGLLIKSEEFLYKKVTVDNNYEDSPSPPDQGNNIVGLIPGKFFNTSEDQILVVGAHWDTFGLSPGVDDNGSGVAAVLEAARILASAKCFVPDFSVFFVAFDAEESGCRGSQDFIHSHLAPHLQATGGSSLGAFILDTVLNFDSSIGSQHFSKAWREFGKSNIRSIEARGGKGDFVTTVARDDAKDENLRTTLAKYLASNNGSGFYHEAITVGSLNGDELPSMEPIVDSSHFWMSDHSRFWYHLVAGLDMINLGGVLISDTAYLRGHMEDCYHRECDTFEDLMEPEKSLEFLQFVTEALVKAIFELTMPKSSSLETCELDYELPKKEIGLVADDDFNNGLKASEGYRPVENDLDVDLKNSNPEAFKNDDIIIDLASQKYVNAENAGNDLSVNLDVENDLDVGESQQIDSLAPFLQGPEKGMTVKNYQPNSGMQINIEHFNIHHYLPASSDPGKSSGREENFLLMNENAENLSRIVEKYFGFGPAAVPQKQKIKNSPMLIAVDKYEL